MTTGRPGSSAASTQRSAATAATTTSSSSPASSLSAALPPSASVRNSPSKCRPDTTRIPVFSLCTVVAGVAVYVLRQVVVFQSFDAFEKTCWEGKSATSFFTECLFWSWDSPFVVWTVQSFVGCFVAQLLGSWLFPVLLRRRYDDLSKEDQFLFTSKFLSYIHAVVSGLVALRVLVEDQEVRDDIAFGTSYNAHVVVGISFGYMVYDILSYVNRSDADRWIIIHHLVAAFALWYNTISRIGTSLTVGFLVTELTTPLVQQQWFMRTLKMEKSIWFTLNGIALWLLWLVFRIGVSLYIVWHMWSTFPVWQHLPMFIKINAVIPHIFLTLNVVWYVKITQSVVRKLRGSPASTGAAGGKAEMVRGGADVQRPLSGKGEMIAQSSVPEQSAGVSAVKRRPRVGESR